MAVIAIDLGGTKVAGALFNTEGKILHKDTGLLEKREGRQVGALLAGVVRTLLQNAASRGEHVDAVGVCVPGISYSRSGTVWAPNIPGWEEYPLRQELRSVVESDSTRLGIDSDRACYILGEVWQGSAKGARDAIFLAVGTGIGAGIMAGGEILRGANDIAGAIGWLALDRPFMKKYVACGCFEYHASGEGIARVTREMLAERKDYRGVLTSLPAEKITAREVFDAYDAHDPVAESVLGQSIEFWGMATANLVSLFNPEKIIFGGGVFGPAVRFLKEIMVEARKWAQPISITKVKLETSLLGSDAGLYGAGYLALQSCTHSSGEELHGQ
jgi:glucokinase